MTSRGKRACGAGGPAAHAARGPAQRGAGRGGQAGAVLLQHAVRRHGLAAHAQARLPLQQRVQRKRAACAAAVLSGLPGCYVLFRTAHVPCMCSSAWVYQAGRKSEHQFKMFYDAMAGK